MPFLPSSGPLSINDIRNLFGGPSSPSMANYYRGGAYIPATKSSTVTVREPSSGAYFSRDYYSASYWYVGTGGYTPGGTNGYNVVTFLRNYSTGTGVDTFAGNGVISSFTYAGATYFRGAFQTFSYDDYYSISENFFQIYRTYQSTVTTDINTNVPTSGQISLSQFYGAEQP